jgi:hypothetical protein
LEKGEKTKGNHLEAKFASVQVLIGLPFFHIISAQMISSLLFAAGNIAVEILLVTYLLKNASKTETANPDTERLRLATIVEKESLSGNFSASLSCFFISFLSKVLRFVVCFSCFFFSFFLGFVYY